MVDGECLSYVIKEEGDEEEDTDVLGVDGVVVEGLLFLLLLRLVLRLLMRLLLRLLLRLVL